MTPQNINHLIDAIEGTVAALGLSGLFAYVLTTIFKNS